MPGSSRSPLVSGREGQVLPVVTVALGALLGLAALAIDVGLLYHARTEAQRTADAAALAGAGALIQHPGDLLRVRSTVIDFAASNGVRGRPVTLLPQDIDVVVDSQKVRVRVVLNETRGSAIPTLFARALGFREVAVASEASAGSYAANTVNCLIPVAIPDRWSEGPNPALLWPGAADRFGDDPFDFFRPWNPAMPEVPPTGYGQEDVGAILTLRQATASGGFRAGQHPRPGHYLPIRGSSGVDSGYKYGTARCDHPSQLWSTGQTVFTQPSDHEVDIAFGARYLIEADPAARWDHTCRCVVGSAFPVSPRIRPIALFDPRNPPPPGSSPLEISGFAGVFVESVTGNQVQVRLVNYAGLNPSETLGPLAGSLARVLRLVD